MLHRIPKELLEFFESKNQMNKMNKMNQHNRNCKRFSVWQVAVEIGQLSIGHLAFKARDPFWDLFGAVRFSVATMLPNDVAQQPGLYRAIVHETWCSIFPGLCQCQCWKSRLSRGLLEGQKKTLLQVTMCQMCAKCVPNDASFVRFGFVWSPAYPVCHKYLQLFFSELFS